MTLIKFSKFNLYSTYTWKDLKDHIYFLLDYITKICTFYTQIPRKHCCLQELSRITAAE